MRLERDNLARDNGALAQLGERLLCKHQVIGSIPIGSTTLSVLLQDVGNQFATRTTLVVVSVAIRDLSAYGRRVLL